MLRFIQTVAIILLVLTGSVGIVLWYLNTRDYRARIETALEDATGYVVSIGGKLHLTLSPLPSIVAGDVRIANPPWVRRAELARADRVEVGLDLWSLLVQGPPRIDRVTVRNATIQLETDPDGRANWLVKRPDEDGKPIVAPDIRRLDMENTVVSYRHGPTGQDFAFKIREGRSAMPLADQLTAEIEGEYRSTGFRAVLRGGRLTRLVNDDTQWPLMITIAAAGGTFDARGTVDRPLSRRGLDLKVTLSGDRLDAWRPMLQLWLPPIRPYRSSFHITGDGGRYQLADFTAGFAHSDLSGRLRVDLTGGKPRVDGMLRAETLRLLDLVGIPEPDQPPPESDRLFDTQPIPFEALKETDVRITAEAQRLLTWPMEMHAASAEIDLQAGRMVIEPFRAAMADGRLDLRFEIDATRPEARAGVRGRAEGVRLEILLPHLGLKVPPEGSVEIDTDLTGRGNSLRALAAAAEGSVDFAVGHGALPIWGFDLIAADLVQAMMPWARQADRTPLNCMVARFNVNDGFARTGSLLIDTSRITVGGAGAINLANEEMDFLFRPRPKDPSLISLAAPVRINGTLKNHKARPDAVDLAAKGAATLLLGSINPVAVIVPFLDVGTGVDNPCLSAVQPGGATTVQRPRPRGPIGTTIDFVTGTLGRAFGLAPRPN